MSTVKSKNLQVGTDATASNNFTIYQPSTPDGTFRIGVGNADSPTEVGRFTNDGYVATNAPSFRAYRGTGQSVTGGVFTKIAFNTEVWDTNSCYDTTNYRFTPNVAGYYSVQCNVYDNTTGQLVFVKNGSYSEYGPYGAFLGHQLHALIYMNGSTDYLEAFIYQSATATSSNNTVETTQFSAFLARAT